MKQVGLLVGLRVPPAWPALVGTLAGVAEARVADPGTDEVDAWLASSPDVPGVNRVRGPIVVLPDERLPLPDNEGIDASTRLPITPFVRARWRRRHHLPATLVLDLDQGVPADLVPTAAALASAVVASGSNLLEAQAWAAPYADNLDDARQLAADDRRAAEVGRAGRRLVERNHDVSRASARLRRLLGLADEPSRYERALDALWTPPTAGIRHRAAAALASLT
jgi:hypothetical protein